MKAYFKLDTERDEAGFFLVASLYWPNQPEEQYEYPSRFATKKDALESAVHEEVLKILQGTLIRYIGKGDQIHTSFNSDLYRLGSNQC